MLKITRNQGPYTVVGCQGSYVIETKLLVVANPIFYLSEGNLPSGIPNIYNHFWVPHLDKNSSPEKYNHCSVLKGEDLFETPFETKDLDLQIILISKGILDLLAAFMDVSEFNIVTKVKDTSILVGYVVGQKNKKALRDKVITKLQLYTDYLLSQKNIKEWEQISDVQKYLGLDMFFENKIWGIKPQATEFFDILMQETQGQAVFNAKTLAKISWRSP